MSEGLITTEELLTRLGIAVRMASYHAMDCSNHLAVHSPPYAQTLHGIAIGLSEYAVVVRQIATDHSVDKTSSE